MLPVTPEDASKALDAIIVMIGIVSVLIVNVCYLGAASTFATFITVIHTQVTTAM